MKNYTPNEFEERINDQLTHKGGILETKRIGLTYDIQLTHTFPDEKEYSVTLVLAGLILDHPKDVQDLLITEIARRLTRSVEQYALIREGYARIDENSQSVQPTPKQERCKNWEKKRQELVDKHFSS